MKWMIVGGQGQLGRAMADELVRQGTHFVSLNRQQLDITNGGDIHDCFLRENPDVVLNAAAWTNVDSAETHEEHVHEVNVEGPIMLAEECARIKARYIHISTDYVFGGSTNTPWKENAPHYPLSVYGKSKSESERILLNENLEKAYVVRTAWLYSPWNTNFVKKIMKAAIESSEDVYVVEDQIGQPTSAIDLAVQLFKMNQQNVESGIYHGTNSGEASWFDLACQIFELIGQDSERVVARNSFGIDTIVERPRYSVLGHDNWNKVGIAPMRNWEEALKEIAPEILSEVKREI